MESFPRSPEFSREPDDKKPEKDSKTEKKIGGKVAETLIKPPAEVRADSLEPKNAESIWQRIAALAEKREIDKALLKPVESADNDAKLAAKTERQGIAEETSDDRTDTELIEAAKDAGAEHSAAESERNAEELPLESLDREEQRETIRRYTENRRLEIEDELRELPDGASVPVESAADLAFLKFVEDQLAGQPDQPIAEALNGAESTTVGQLSPEEAAHQDEPVSEEETGENTEGGSEVPAEGEIPLHGSQPDDEDMPIIIDQSGTQGTTTPPTAGGGNGNMPPTPPGPPGGPPTPPPGPGPGSNPNVPSPGPSRTRTRVPWTSSSAGYNPSMPLTTPNTPLTPNVLYRSPDDLLTERRRAMAQGLLVGLLVGYFFGRRRGRIKTEKKLLPVQKKLEKQVKSLTESVAYKEQLIRKQAAESAAKLKDAEKRRLSERLTAAAAVAAPVAAVTERAATHADTADFAPDSAYEPGIHASELHAGRQHSVPGQRAERLGQMLIEAPAATLLAAGAGEAAGANIDFTKKVEDYSSADLRQAAEKIRIDGVTLRELQTAHRLDEKAVRQIVAAFVEGKNVREVLNKVLFEKEAKYEQDPQLQKFGGQGQNGAGGGTAAAAASAAIEMSGDTGSANSPSGSASSWMPPIESARQKPADPWEVAREHQRQVIELGVGVLMLIAIAIILVALLH